MSRYSRHIVLEEIGQAGQDKLAMAKVLVIGAGGLGCPVLQYLAAAGVGTIGIVDFDVVEQSNLQRQILFGSSSIGLNKAIAAKARLEDLNPTITIEAYPEKLIPQNALALFETYDVVVDGTDNFTSRYLINDAALITKRPLVYGAIYKFEGQVAVFNYREGPSYRCLFPIPPKAGSVANCSEVGVLGVLPGIIGSMQANEVLKIVLGFGNVLSGKLYCFNAKTSKASTLYITKNPSEINQVLSTQDHFATYNYDLFCSTDGQEITAEAAIKMNDTLFVDVREIDEEPSIALENYIRIPLNTLEHNLDKIRAEKTTILVCQSGVRSLSALNILVANNKNNIYSLKGGVTSLIEQLNTFTE